MEVQIFDDYKELSVHIAAFIHTQIILKPDLLFCPATGNSPLATYAEMVKIASLEPQSFSLIRIIKLDEWDHIGMSHPSSCEYYLKIKLLDPLKVDANRYYGFNNEAPNLIKECDRMEKILLESGPIDLCVLGVGLNGHIGFNEPAEKLNSVCHLAPLSPTSLSHSMLDGLSSKPSHGITIGMGGIFRARQIVLIITGEQKKNIYQFLMTKKITTQIPASLLWLHPKVSVFVDKSAVS